MYAKITSILYLLKNFVKLIDRDTVMFAYLWNRFKHQQRWISKRFQMKNAHSY